MVQRETTLTLFVHSFVTIRRAGIALVATLALVLAACGGSSASSPTATPVGSPTTIATATSEPGPPSPQVERVIEHMRVLSEEIGSRLAGSENIDRAAEYAREQFERWGYVVELQDFSDSRPEVRIFAQVHAEPEPRDLHSIVFLGSKPGSVGGRLVDVGSGLDEEFPADTGGAIVLIQRGDTLFNDMAARAKAHGAIGAIVANNKEGLFRGTIEPRADLPFAAISQVDGEALREQLADGAVEVSIDVPASIDGTNVIARPPSGTCRTLSGAHYDTVPWARGAVDNASGSALVLELARASSAAGLTDHCFALFSAEEEGLLGSKHFVSLMSEEAKTNLAAYFNYDVVVGGATVDVIGDVDLATEAVALGTQAGGDFVLAKLAQGSSSDHASFSKVGIPVAMMTVDDLGVLHTERDTFEFASQHTEPLQPIADAAFELIQSVLPTASP